MANEVVPLLREISEPVSRAHYEKRLARLLDIGDDVVREAVNRQRPSQRKATRAIKTPAAEQGQRKATLEDYAIALAQADPRVIPQTDIALEQLGLPASGPADFTDAANRELYRHISLWSAFINPDPAALDDLAGPELAERLAAARALELPFTDHPRLARELAATLLRLREALFSDAIRAAADDDDALNAAIRSRTAVQQGRDRLAFAARSARAA
jgi:DNA primase